MNKAEKHLLIEIIANVDDLIETLSLEQYIRLEKGINKIRGNYLNLLEGVKTEGEREV